jgi:hypothetical protein
MTQISKTSYKNLYAIGGTTIQSGVINANSGLDLQTAFEDMTDSFLSIQDNFIDDDTMSTASATTAPSSESVKAYVDSLTLVKRARVQITGGSSTRSIGTSPQTILAAPGSGFWYNIISVSITYDYGSAVYDFGSSSDIQCKFSGVSTSAWNLDYAIMNQASNFNYRLTATGADGFNCPENTAFVLTTANGANATTGDGDVQVIVVYTLEAINS